MFRAKIHLVHISFDLTDFSDMFDKETSEIKKSIRNTSIVDVSFSVLSLMPFSLNEACN